MQKLTQIERKRRVRELIDRQEYHKEFNQLDVNAMNNLCGWNFAFYKRVYNLEYPTDTRCVMNSDDGEHYVTWSWNRAISGVNILNQAFRKAVEPQMRVIALHLPDLCSHCQAKEYLTVDHLAVPFSTIMADFLKMFPDVNSENGLANAGKGGGWYIKDPELKSIWEDFHSKHATYQVLCRSCNASKGVKNAVQKSR